MPAEVVADLLSDKDGVRRLMFQVVLQCAPLLKGIKIACMMNLDYVSCRMLSSILQGTQISWYRLTVRDGRYLVILFRPDEFAAYLKRDEVCGFLKEYGYEPKNLFGTLESLSRKIRYCFERNQGFPHEIGVFLDYPIEDVKGFIEKKGQSSLLSGYWKVYHDREEKEKTFLAYDKARSDAVQEFLIGKCICDIAKEGFLS